MKQKYIQIQNEMITKIDRCNRVDLSEVRSVAGVDLAYWKRDDKEYAVCCIVVIDFQTREVIEKQEYINQVTVPYIPGCLAFREIPLCLEANRKLESRPDIYMFDGNGYLHPRHMGLAVHAGILLNAPTIGVAKSFYKIEGADFTMPEDAPCSYTDIRVEGEVYGRVLRTQEGVRPVFVSVGNMIDLDTATAVVSRMAGKESHIPIPTRLADIMTHEVRREVLEKEIFL